MMKKLCFSLAVLLTLFSCGQQANYTINGTIQDVADSTLIKLSYVDHGKMVTVDSTIITGGVFKFSGYQPADRYFLSVASVKRPFEFFIAGTNEIMEIKLTNTDNMIAGTVSGSELNEQYAVFQKDRTAIYEEIGKLMDDYRSEVKNINENKKLKPADIENQLKELDGRTEARYNELDAQQNELTKAFVMANSNNVAGQRTFQQSPYMLNAEELTAFVGAIQDKTTTLAKDIQQRLDNVNKTLDGQPFIDVELNNTEDQPVKLSTWLGKGTYVLVDFWASWCGPCRRENPNVVAMYQKYHEKGLDIVGISRDRAKDKWLEAIEKDGLVWNHVWDEDGVAAQQYVVDFIPTIFLFDKEGNIVTRGLHGETLRAKLVEIFGE